MGGARRNRMGARGSERGFAWLDGLGVAGGSELGVRKSPGDSNGSRDSNWNLVSSLLLILPVLWYFRDLSYQAVGAFNFQRSHGQLRVLRRVEQVSSVGHVSRYMGYGQNSL